MEPRLLPEAYSLPGAPAWLGFLAVITVPACRSCLPGSGWEALLCQNLETLACFKGALPVHLGAS